MDVRYMEFDDRTGKHFQRIQDRNRRKRIASGIDDDAAAAIDRLVYPVDKLCFAVRLPKLYSAVLRLATTLRLDLRERHLAVDFRLSFTQAIEIGTVQDINRLVVWHRVIPYNRIHSTLVTHDSGQPEYGLRDKRDDSENYNRDKHEGQRLANNGHQGLFGHVRDDEEQQAERRCQEADHAVDNHDDAKMDKVDSKRLGGRDHDRDDDEENCGPFEQAPEEQQNHVHQQKVGNRGYVKGIEEVLNRQ